MLAPTQQPRRPVPRGCSAQRETGRVGEVARYSVPRVLTIHQHLPAGRVEHKHGSSCHDGHRRDGGRRRSPRLGSRCSTPSLARYTRCPVPRRAGSFTRRPGPILAVLLPRPAISPAAQSRGRRDRVALLRRAALAKQEIARRGEGTPMETQTLLDTGRGRPAARPRRIRRDAPRAAVTRSEERSPTLCPRCRQRLAVVNELPDEPVLCAACFVAQKGWL